MKIAIIRRDGETQCRSALNSDVVREYAEALAEGATFPPLKVWYDGSSYWLSDGFQRLAAAEIAGIPEMEADIRYGTLSDARWDSCAANSSHGLRRSGTDVEIAVTRALAYPNAARLSNNELAKHLGVPESTLRVIRKRLNILMPRGELRLVTRAGSSFAMNTAAIGRTKPCRKTKSIKALASDLAEMKASASPRIMPLLNIMSHWILGSSTAHECLVAIDRLQLSPRILQANGFQEHREPPRPTQQVR